MIRAVVGTAGHIDHGKTALVGALTGVRTDRLKEEQERGITIDLGFADLRDDEDGLLGVVDVPGHEDFVRTMVAGASGMDVVLLALAADEGVMPQTREHLAVVELLGVPEMVVALTKTDLVEEAWLELVEEEIREVLADTPWPDPPVVRTSARTGDGVEALRRTLFEVAGRGRRRRSDDVVRLPVDRSFTVQGTGTVVTGTLWSGTLRAGETVRVLPAGTDARIRGLQNHGADVEAAGPGARVAMALTGGEVDRESVARGSTVVGDAPWPVGHMLTVRARVLPGTGWRLEHNQRLHVHLGTQEVLGRCAVLDGEAVEPGEEAWIQLRLEAPVAARARDRVVLRSYSPVTTIAGGRVAEAGAPKRRRLDGDVRPALEAVLDGDPAGAVEARAALSGWSGVDVASLALHVGLPPADVAEAAEKVEAAGGALERGRLWGPAVVAEADRRLLAALEDGHRREPLRPAVPLAALRQALPAWTGAGLADARLEALRDRGELEIQDTGARRPGWRVEPSPDQRAAADRLRALYAEAGLQPPDTGALPEDLRAREDLDALLAHLAHSGDLIALDEDHWIQRQALEDGARSVREALAGRTGLGPADFREALPVTRKHLIPLLGWLDAQGITTRGPDGRDVPPAED